MRILSETCYAKQTDRFCLQPAAQMQMKEMKTKQQVV